MSDHKLRLPADRPREKGVPRRRSSRLPAAGVRTLDRVNELVTRARSRWKREMH